MGGFQPVDIGHRQVENDYVGPQRLKLLHSREPAFSLSADRPGMGLQHYPNHAAGYFGVLHYQDAKAQSNSPSHCYERMRCELKYMLSVKFSANEHEMRHARRDLESISRLRCLRHAAIRPRQRP